MEAIRVWHDDVRPPEYDGWTWVKTNTEAQELLETGRVVAIDLDHDLGAVIPDGADPMDHLRARGESPDGTGLDLVEWMVEHRLVPPKVRIHSWYRYGAHQMANALARAGRTPEVRRYVPPPGVLV